MLLLYVFKYPSNEDLASCVHLPTGRKIPVSIFLLIFFFTVDKLTFVVYLRLCMYHEPVTAKVSGSAK